MDHTVIILGLCFILGVITIFIDELLGIDLTIYPIWKHFFHKAAYMFLGAVIVQLL